jgi:hypothetical protein
MVPLPGTEPCIFQTETGQWPVNRDVCITRWLSLNLHGTPVTTCTACFTLNALPILLRNYEMSLFNFVHRFHRLGLSAGFVA